MFKLMSKISEKIKDIRRIKLTYTEEMKKQDILWKKEQEDLEVMKRLYEDIISEARSKGFAGKICMYSTPCNEMVADVYRSEEEYVKHHEQGIESDLYAGYCKRLIENLECVLNE